MKNLRKLTCLLAAMLLIALTFMGCGAQKQDSCAPSDTAGTEPSGEVTIEGIKEKGELPEENYIPE